MSDTKKKPIGNKTGTSKSPRRRAREFALQGLYQWKVGGADEAAVDDDDLDEHDEDGTHGAETSDSLAISAWRWSRARFVRHTPSGAGRAGAIVPMWPSTFVQVPSRST